MPSYFICYDHIYVKNYHTCKTLIWTEIILELYLSTCLESYPIMLITNWVLFWSNQFMPATEGQYLRVALSSSVIMGFLCFSRYHIHSRVRPIFLLCFSKTLPDFAPAIIGTRFSLNPAIIMFGRFPDIKL